LDPDIKFTTEGEENGELAFLDTSTVKKEDGSLKVKIYRKPTHTDQYLQFDSNHPLEHKLSVVRTLHHRASTVITEDADKEKERKHVNEALKKCGYPEWAIKRGASTTQRDKTNKKSESTEDTKKTMVGVPYIKDLSEAIRRIMKDYGCAVYFKPRNTIRQLLCSPKDPAKKEEICGVVYQINCGGTRTQKCTSTYVGETSKTLKTRFDQHRRPSSTSSHVSLHLHQPDRESHTITMDNIKILDRDPCTFERKIREAIHIRRLKPDLNKNVGAAELPAIYSNILPAADDVTPLSRDD